MRGNLRVSGRIKQAVFLFLFLTGAFPAFTQEKGADSPARVARWFRSNAGGMTLEEAASRTSALHNEYALLIDYARQGDLPLLLTPFYRSGYTIEFHALYHRGTESRRQWIFRDAKGTARLVSVLNQDREAPPPPKPAVAAPPEDGGATDGDAEGSAAGGATDSAAEGESVSNSDPPTGRSPWGFIEIYNEDYRITEEYMFSDEGEETQIAYSYRGGLLIRAEAGLKKTEEQEESKKIYTDDYRYNRSSSLRAVERLYHEELEALPIRFAFPNRVLDAAKETDFIGEKLAYNPEFFGDFDVKPGYRMVYNTDERGRLLTQSLLDDQDKVIWVIQNTWSGNRIASSLKTEGEEKLLIEYEYNSGGDRIVERNVRNGVLERLVRASGGREVEELYMNGEVVLRATWENGRKISEDRMRRNR
jgi:hypothetical protein